MLVGGMATGVRGAVGSTYNYNGQNMNKLMDLVL